jgi:hypothetical protein
MEAQSNFSRTPIFRNFLDGLAGLEWTNRIVHGVFIELHPIWRRVIDYERAVRSGFDWPIVPLPWIQCGPYDPSYVPDLWRRQYLEKWHKEGPFLVKIYVLPTNSETHNDRKKIEEYARGQPFFAVVVDSPLPTMAAAIEGAAEISATMTGTLGGFLKDQNGETWGLTCGHVAQSTTHDVVLENVEGRRLKNACSIVYTNFTQLKKLAPQQLCHSSGTATDVRVDLALLQVDNALAPQDTVKGLSGKIDAVYDKNKLDSGSSVVVRGSVTGPHEYTVQGFGVTQKVGLNGTEDQYCFSDVFDFATDTQNRLQRALAPLPVHGDSGSWVLFERDFNYALYGMVFAVRGARAIAAFAESITAWAADKWTLNLGPL